MPSQKDNKNDKKRLRQNDNERDPDDPLRDGKVARSLQELREFAVEAVTMARMRSEIAIEAAHTASTASYKALTASQKAEEAAALATRAEKYLTRVQTMMEEHSASMENPTTNVGNAPKKNKKR